MALKNLGKQVHDPVVRDKLTPRYGLGCKRPSFSNEYLPTFNRANVSARDDPDRGDHAVRVRVADGTEHEVDVLICATGFQVFDKGNMPPFPVRGNDGVELAAWWDENRFQAYEGVSVPGFPNIFMILGPYGFNGASYFTLIENQARHIVRCLTRAQARGSTAIEISERGQPPLLGDDARPPRPPGLLLGHLLDRQQLLLRLPRRRPVSRLDHPRGRLAQRPLRPRRLPLHPARGVKAAVIYENGPPEVLRYEDVPDPECPDGCVVVDVEAISIEGGDLLARAARRRRRPRTSSATSAPEPSPRSAPGSSTPRWARRSWR